MSENAIRTIDIPTVFPLSVPGNQIAPGIWIGLNTVIHPSARLAPPLCIGEGCLIGYNAELGPGTVIGPSVVVDDEATIQHSTILRRSYVGRLVNISHRLVHQSKMIDLATGYHIDIEDKFLISRVALPGWQKNIFFRIIDIFVAIILISVLMPLIILMVLLIMIFISRKPFDVKSCYGRRAFENRSKCSVQIVRILAFRTASKNGSVKTLGKIIGFCGIERIPELWNVIKGDLRIVGVKPLSMAEYSYAEKNGTRNVISILWDLPVYGISNLLRPTL